MTFLWKRRRSGSGSGSRHRGGGGGKKESPKGINNSSIMELTIPTHFRCPISLDLMKDPVSLSTGITYDRESIDTWFNTGNATCPVTNHTLRNLDQVPNHSLRKMIQDWCVANKSYGVERIPTPRVPITPFEVSEVCTKIEEATCVRDESACRELLKKIKNSAKESERNRRCIVSNGFGTALAGMVESFARFSIEKHAILLREIVSALTWNFPYNKSVVSKLKSTVSLSCLSWFLKHEDLTSRQNAIFVLRELVVYGDQGCLDGLIEVKGIEETLFNIVKVPICPKATQACLVIINHMMLSRPLITSKFVKMGLIPLVLEILVDGNKSTCEKALCILDTVCNSEEGKKGANENALTIPIVVKKILRVSNTATELSISILWKISVGENEKALVEALQLGAFQKMLVVLQVGCGESGTKGKVTELLRMMNVFRGKVDCFDSSMGFKLNMSKSN